MLVAFDAAQADRVGGVAPQLVVAGHPHHLAEAAGEGLQGPADVGGLLRDVTGDQQPVVVGLRAQPLHDGPVLRISDVQVADGQQLPGTTGRRRHIPSPDGHSSAPRQHIRTPGTRTFRAGLRGGGIFRNTRVALRGWRKPYDLADTTAVFPF
ncbi:hypothetical protein GCM10020256_08090 [Streptomyces thermocoprophilus]